MHVTFQASGLVDRSGDVAFDPTAQRVPERLAGVPVQRLGLVNGAITDLSALSAFWIDARGQKHPQRAESPGEPSWSLVTCAFADELASDGNGGWRLAAPADKLMPFIQAECSRRISARASQKAQINANRVATLLVAGALASGQPLSDSQKADVATAAAVSAWIDATLAACRTLVAAGDSTFADDAHWPAWDPAWTAFVARF